MGNGNSTGVVVHIDKPFYYPGEWITGRCAFNVVEKDLAKRERQQVVLTMQGKEEVHWTERRRRNKKTRTVHYRGENVFWNQSFEVTNFPGKVYPRGQFEIPFRVQVPMQCASYPSFYQGVERGHASIVYSVAAEVQCNGWFSSNAGKYTGVFSVGNVVNAIAPPMEPRSVMERQPVYGCCCSCSSSGTIEYTASIPKDIFYLGEQIPVRIQLENQSDSDFALSVSMDWTMTYASSSKTREFTATISSLAESIKARTNNYDNTLILNVPQQMNYTEMRGQLIHAFFQVSVSVSDGGCGRSSTHNTMPVSVLPILSSQQQAPVLTDYANFVNEDGSNFVPNQAFNQANAPPNNWQPQYLQEIAPPSYNDAMDAPTPLPPGWEEARDPATGAVYYINHSTQTTSWTDPRQAVELMVGG